MIIVRQVATVPAANRDRALAMLKESIGKVPLSHPPLKAQVSVSVFGRSDQICVEYFCESLAHYEQVAAELLSHTSPESAHEWETIPVPGGTNEAWEVIFEYSD